MAKQYRVVLFNLARGIITHFVNTANEKSAIHICEGLFPDMRAIEVEEMV